MGLTRDLILEADDLVRETVDVPEWGGQVIVRTMTGTERDTFELNVTEQRRAKRQPNLRALLAALTIVDENGGRVFSEDDAVRLGLKSAGALDRVFAVAARLNCIGQGDVEALEKNS